LGAVSDISIKMMIFIGGLLIIVVLIAFETPGINSIYHGINAGVGKSGMNLIVRKFNDVYDKYYMWTLSNDPNSDKNVFKYETQFSVLLSPGIYLLYPDSDGYYRIDYYSESNVDIYKLSLMTIDSPEKFASVIKNSDLITSEFLGFKETDLEIQGLTSTGGNMGYAEVMVILVGRHSGKVVFNLKVVKSDSVSGLQKPLTPYVVIVHVKNADVAYVQMSYSVLDSNEVKTS